MIEMGIKIDNIDRKILDLLQRDAALSQRGIAEKVGLSQNALWRRLKRLEEGGVLRGARMASIPQVVEMHRIGGDWDYMLKIVTRGMGGYDAVYRRLTTGFELDTVTGFFSMETMLDDRPLDVSG